MNADPVAMLRTAAQALGYVERAHAPALVGLLLNRADDMERNIAAWRRAGQDVAALVNQHYGVYLTTAVAVLLSAGTTGNDGAPRSSIAE